MIERKKEKRCFISVPVLDTCLNIRELIGLRDGSIVDKKAVKNQIIKRWQMGRMWDEGSPLW